MNRAQYVVTRLLAGVLTLGCIGNKPGGDTQAVATATASTTDNQTSASDHAADETASDSASTMEPTPTSGPDSTSGSTGGSCSFLDCTDMMPPVEECDNFAQDCPEGQKCAAFIDDGEINWTKVKCVNVIGTDRPGEPCTAEDPTSGVDSCIKGAMCWEVNKDGVGICRALCTGTADTPICDPPGFCTVGGYSTLNLCIPSCDPLLQDCLGTGDACYANFYFFCLQDTSGEGGQANDPCELLSDCDPGLQCTLEAFVGMGCAPGSLGCCTPFCQFPGGACPNPDQQCMQYLDPMQPLPDDPQLDVGLCGVPG